MKSTRKYYFYSVILITFIIYLWFLYLFFYSLYAIEVENSKRIHCELPTPAPNATEALLPRNLRVDSYHLHFQLHFPTENYQPDPQRNMSFNGNTSVLFTMTENAEEILIDAFGLNFSSICK